MLNPFSLQSQIPTLYAVWESIGFRSTHIPGDLVEAKLNSSADYCSSLFYGLSAWKNKGLAGAGKAFLSHLIEKGVMFLAFSVFYSCCGRVTEPDGKLVFHLSGIQTKHLVGHWSLKPNLSDGA